MWKDSDELRYRSAEEKSICKPKSPVLKDLPIGFNQRIELRHTGPAMHCAGDEEGSREDRADPASWSLQSYGGKKHKASNSQTI